MRKTSRITRISILLAFFFGIDKVLGVFRQLIIGRQFGISQELDVFNAANNLPDMLFALISGGALAMALIPVLSEVLSKKGQITAWKVFSNILNIAFIITASISIIIALLAEPLVNSQIGIAPGFTEEQQLLTASLMRLNLIATLLFSVSGLVMAGLQANQHFLFPAIAPIFYDLGQIFGAVILAPTQGLQIGSVRLPAFGLGIEGLVYGVIIGAFLHLLIQVPGLVKYKFKWSPIINVNDIETKKILALIGPRLLSVIAFQLIFLAQDNLASRLQTGSVTALTYGWLIMQVPETLIGTAIATALLPTLSEYAAKEKWNEFMDSLSKALKGMVVLTLPIASILAISLGPLIQVAFSFSDSETNFVVMVTRSFLLGLTAHSLTELLVRSFYARQKALIPMLGSFLSLILFLFFALIFMKPWDAAGIAVGNSLAYIFQAIFLIWISRTMLRKDKENWIIFLKSVITSLIGGLIAFFILKFGSNYFPPIFLSIIALGTGTIVSIVLLKREYKALIHL